MENKIAKVEKKDMSVEGIISQAVQSGASIETLEKLLVLRKEYRADQAREAFVTAMSEFQSTCPVIKKTKKVMNKDGATVRYQYAPIDSIVEQIKKPLADNGLSYSFDVKNETGFIIAVATITHKDGHSKTSEFKIPIDSEGYMTAPQKYASALTFAKRYALCNALGISTGDEDTDATDVNKEKLPKSDKSKIALLLRNLGHEVIGKSKVEADAIVKKLTGEDMNPENFVEIVSKLQVLVSEKDNEGPEIR